MSVSDEPPETFAPEPGKDDPHRPRHLKRLFNQMHDIIQQHESRNGRSVRKKKKNEVTRYCDICKAVFHEEQIIFTGEKNDAPTPKTCQNCQNELAQGGVAVIAPDARYLFVWGAGVVDLPQKNNVSQEEYDAIVQYVKDNPKPEQPI